MTFQKGQSGNPAGRPPGARNRATMIVEQLFDDEAADLTRTAITQALQGDAAALRICMDRIAPLRRERTIELDLPPLATASDAANALAMVAAAVARGELTPGEAAGLLKVIDGYTHALEVVTLEQRVANLEKEIRP
jgi:uncharacterized protein DUF5681